MEEQENKEPAVFLPGPIHSYCEAFKFFRFYRRFSINQRKEMVFWLKENFIDSEVKRNVKTYFSQRNIN